MIENLSIHLLIVNTCQTFEVGCFIPHNILCMLNPCEMFAILRIYGGNTEIPTCAADRVDTAQNGCIQRGTAFDRAILAVTETVRLSMFSVDSRFLQMTSSGAQKGPMVLPPPPPPSRYQWYQLRTIGGTQICT